MGSFGVLLFYVPLCSDCDWRYCKIFLPALNLKPNLQELKLCFLIKVDIMHMGFGEIV